MLNLKENLNSQEQHCYSGKLLNLTAAASNQGCTGLCTAKSRTFYVLIKCLI